MRVIQSIWVPVVFLVFAGVFMLDPVPFVSPVPLAAKTAAWVTDLSPVRRPKLKPEYQVGAFTYRCSDCHRIIPSPAETHRKLVQHTEIKLAHGLNTRCFNCHGQMERDAFVDDFGKPIPWDQPQLLCGKCHGPVYRDWEAGSHGRMNGYWDASLGPQSHRRCIECHDPHNPRFPDLKPAPGPRTLRAESRSSTRHGTARDPLRVFDGRNEVPETH